MARQFGVFTIRADGRSGKAADQFENSVLGMLHGLNHISSGKALLDGFGSIGREVLIFPYDGTEGQCNAYATNDWGMFRNKVSFSPMGWTACSSCSTIGSAGNSAFEVLYHELAHALRFAAGTIYKKTSASQEEEIAILLTNIFSSETNRPLRRDHSGFRKLPNTDPVAFYANNLPLIRTFHKQHPKLSTALSMIWTKFNPIKEYVDREL